VRGARRKSVKRRKFLIILFAASLISGCAGEVIATPIKLVDPDAKNTPVPRIAATATSEAMVKATITPTATVITTMAASYTPTVTATETLTPTLTSTMTATPSSTPTMKVGKEKNEGESGGNGGGGPPPGGHGGSNG
jgi:hypothetical protein